MVINRALFMSQQTQTHTSFLKGGASCVSCGPFGISDNKLFYPTSQYDSTEVGQVL
jgi:hypothetical protein